MAKNKVEILPPTPTRKKEIPLTTLGAVRSELAQVYRMCKRAEMDPSTGSRLTYMLVSLAKLIEQSDIEARLTLIENQLQGVKP